MTKPKKLILTMIEDLIIYDLIANAQETQKAMHKLISSANLGLSKIDLTKINLIEFFLSELVKRANRKPKKAKPDENE